PPRFVVTLDAPLGSGDSLTRIPLAVTGKWVRDGNDFSITLEDLEEIVQNFNKRRNGEINVDYDHASEMPEVGAGGPVPSAGRIVGLEGPQEFGTPPSFVGRQDRAWGPVHLPRGGGKTKNSIPLPGGEGGERCEPGEGLRWILYGQYEPTERARQLIESREYRYISPAINWAGRDKRTGKVDGTTLTSVALTNRPFLEELPQIRLSDPAFQLVDVGEVHVDTSLTPGDTEPHRVGTGLAPPSSVRTKSHSGGSMKQVKLSVEDGKIKIAHGDFSDAYYADPADLKKCLEDLGASPDTPDEPDTSLAAELENLAGLAVSAGAGGGAAANAGTNPETRATLSECVAAIRRRLATHQEISLKEAGALLSENEAGGKSIPAADYFRWRVEQELDEAVKNGKVLPRQRDDWRKIALSDFPTFRKIVAEQKPQVPLRPVGVSGAGPEDAQTQVKLLAEQRMRERSISFGQALSEIGREHPDLVHEYRRAVSA
ncbi:MAG TPA: phage protease, partial [Terriglobia bacterium]|nr:phage protease [Terriglobia bacterium]